MRNTPQAGTAIAILISHETFLLKTVIAFTAIQPAVWQNFPAALRKNYGS